MNAQAIASELAKILRRLRAVERRVGIWREDDALEVCDQRGILEPGPLPVDRYGERLDDLVRRLEGR